QQDRIDAMAATTRLRIGAWARGQVAIALLFGLAMGLGLELLGVPYAVSLGVAAGVLELLPYVGGAITVVLAALTALSVGVPQAIGVVVLYLILVNLESHVLAPLLFGKAIGLPPVAILVALLAGVDLLGIAGALLAIPLTVILWVVADELLPRRNTPDPTSASSPTRIPERSIAVPSAVPGPR
ncbi:MAG TPA: AI-2E family transporter, partial [Thermomicrobiales bacterium]|nr:AI-2E family transporter [Thermomicrobiales bacterium]